jgi:hypothetical protein
MITATRSCWRSASCNRPVRLAPTSPSVGAGLGVPLSYGGPGVGLFTTRSSTCATCGAPGRRGARCRRAARLCADARHP